MMDGISSKINATSVHLLAIHVLISPTFASNAPKVTLRCTKVQYAIQVALHPSTLTISWNHVFLVTLHVKLVKGELSIVPAVHEISSDTIICVSPSVLHLPILKVIFVVTVIKLVADAQVKDPTNALTARVTTS
jgi:hypothetical protein